MNMSHQHNDDGTPIAPGSESQKPTTRRRVSLHGLGQNRLSPSAGRLNVREEGGELTCGPERGFV